MAQGPRYHVPYRRRREAKTNYKRRLGLLKSGEARAVVRRTNRLAIVQLIDYQAAGDQVRAAATSKELAKYGWTSGTGNLPAFYLTGLLSGLKARKAGLDEAVLDIGLATPASGTRIFAALQGLIDAGIEIPAGDDIFAPAERLEGTHISEELPELFTKVKQALQEKWS